MNIQKFTQKSLEAIQNATLEKKRYVKQMIGDELKNFLFVEKSKYLKYAKIKGENDSYRQGAFSRTPSYCNEVKWAV